MKSFIFAFRGLKAATRTEPHMRFHLVAALLVIVTGIYFQIGNTEWIMLIFSIGMVITAELFNSAMEELVDLASPQQQPLAGRIKDIAAGGVLVSAVTAAIVGLLVFWSYLY